MEPVLETKNLTKNYGRSRGVEDVSLTVYPGEIYGFIGPNGAGKSTTIRSILGLIFPQSGEVRIFGEDGIRGGASLRKRIGFVPSESNYYDGLKVGKLLRYSAEFYGNDGKNNIEEYSERLKLDLKRPINDLSQGNRKKVAIIQALLHHPELLILDEPTSGLDPLIQMRFYEILREEQERGCTIFFSSHTLSEVERLCSRVAIIRDGKIVNISEMDQLKQLYLKRFRILFKRGKNLVESDLQGVSSLVITKRGAEGLFTGDVRDLMRQLSVLPLEDVVLEDPSLEEIFMHYYSETGEE
ncbi:MAG: ABC transporter ATP-binding protein [Spirochaetaceae bacterium]|jgi:ABC-2 type transport system ATP-binding protein|nr:ABC transporter ATP-binding protein [Spirochaetaceae bacterium]